ncbi:glutamate ligase [Staphylococcus microti]|uniref:Glutamate ligase n=1 Tax=Staphylococcus microti TaxID=569857 RepID=A0A0D6XR48_9STAP|nr:Mur ligase family protein [Staphylococcus microti]KIX90910.1 glutamate ligase [Staphylococcus microti]PNZ83806.1 glutamate ligase [Staphylococcus microti]SUM58518.1 UDP-N-acetylmuramoylalanyl-D-glutamyl-2, 6-diaminopimelate-D-alanyl-D-alanyl ligase [Staphylococcus microti]
MLSIKQINSILNGRTINVDAHNEDNIINDFETIFHYVNSKQTAYFSPNRETWSRFLGRGKGAADGNDMINLEQEDIGLIITEKEVQGLKYPIPQIIIEDSVASLKTLAIYIRNQYTNPLIAITGSMGKSSTRMITASLLQDYDVLENRGNNNVRGAIYSNMLKLVKNPDFAVIETSLNAINYIEDTAVNLRPDVAVVTGIGAAHFSSFKSIEEIAKLKARLFNGLSEDGIAIINGDTLFVDFLKQQASEKTQHVYTYSIATSSDADLTPEFIQYQKGVVRFGIQENDTLQTYELNTISSGMISNTLAALLALKKLNVKVNAEHLKDFQPFTKILNMKPVQTQTHQLTLIDDTHNASLPAMINAIKVFDTQTRFFKGNKIIALGKINDLGHKSREIHQELVPVLSESNADYILCLDNDLRPVVGNIKNKHITWYASKEVMMNDLKFLCNEDSVTLMKSSSGGTDFPEVARKLPHVLSANRTKYEHDELFNEMRRLGQSYLIVDNETLEIDRAVNDRNSMTVDGLSPLIFYLYAADQKVTNTSRPLKEWGTNNKTFYTGREMTMYELLKHVTQSPYPSVLYELSDRLFENFANRSKYTRALIEKYDFDPCVTVNLTGRFMKKERQTYSVHDLYKILKDYQYDLFRFGNSFIMGGDFKSGYIRGRDKTIIFTSYKDPESLKSLITF